MYPRVVGQFWVEATPKHVALPYRYYVLRTWVIVFLVLLQRLGVGRQRCHDLDLAIQLLPRQIIRWCLARRNNCIVPFTLSFLYAYRLLTRKYLLYNWRADEDASVRIGRACLAGRL